MKQTEYGGRCGAETLELIAAGPCRIGLSTTDGREIKRITMRCDGHGLSGHYDVIYIEFDDGSIGAMPAHVTDYWERKSNK